MNELDKYLQNYQDMFIEKELDLKRYPNNMAIEEFFMINQHLDALLSLVDDQNKLTKGGAKQFEKTYETLINTLKNKIKYIKDSAAVFNKLNITYDKNSIVDYLNVKLQEEDIPEVLYYNETQKGYSLPRTSVTTNCPYTVNTDAITITNSNLNIHNAISISNPYFKYLETLDLVILKIDGTILSKRVEIVDFLKNNIIIEHEATASLRFNIKVKYRDEDISQTIKTNILENFKFSLHLNSYSNFATQSFKKMKLNYATYLILNETIRVPNNCYCNYNITINGDISFTSPVANSVVCKRLDLLNKKEVKKIVGMYVKNIYTEQELDLDYVMSLPFPTEKYIIYLPKISENTIVNNKIKVVKNNSFSILTQNSDKIEVDLQLELYSFNNTDTPLLKSIVGFTKNE